MADKFGIKWSKVNNELVELNSLNDVSISNLSDGDQMIYDANGSDGQIRISSDYNLPMERRKEFIIFLKRIHKTNECCFFQHKGLG